MAFLASATAAGRAVGKTMLRFSESLGKGPQFFRVPKVGVIEIGWLFSTPPKGLKEEEMTPDLTLVIRLLNADEEGLEVKHEVHYGPYLPDAAKKKEVCQDALELLAIETLKEQGGR